MEDIFDNEVELQDEQTTEESTDNEVEQTDELAESCESATESAEDTEKTAENEQKPKADKLNPYEKIILAEMERRAKGEDEDLPDDNLADGLASKDKNIHECYQYITAQAKKKAVAGCAMIEDSVVYGWAHHYYIEPKAVIDAELHPKPKDKPKTESKPSNKGATKPATPTPAKTKTESKPKKKATYADNPLLKAVMSKNKGKKNEDTEVATKDKVTKVKRNGQIFTITEFSLF